MKQNGRTLVLALLAIASAGGLWAAWEFFPPVLRYRETVAISAPRTAVRSYLDGRQPLDTAAKQLAFALEQWRRLWDRRQPPVAQGSLVADAIDLTPPGFTKNDPRIDLIQIRAMRFTIPPGVSAEFRAAFERQLDSLEAAHRARRNGNIQ